jgi:type II secretory ATPase GspE/PulE/Tfp pilus assembly ATPase PilB-like protein
MAIQSALTGHLVFSTLHTNDAASAVTRLLDLGIEPYLVSSSHLAVMAQRLVRKVCSDCAERRAPTADEM